MQKYNSNYLFNTIERWTLENWNWTRFEHEIEHNFKHDIAQEIKQEFEHEFEHEIEHELEHEIEHKIKHDIALEIEHEKLYTCIRLSTKLDTIYKFNTS